MWICNYVDDFGRKHIALTTYQEYKNLKERFENTHLEELIDDINKED